MRQRRRLLDTYMRIEAEESKLTLPDRTEGSYQEVPHPWSKASGDNPARGEDASQERSA